MSEYPKYLFNAASGTYRHIDSEQDEVSFLRNREPGEWVSVPTSQYQSAVAATWRVVSGMFADMGAAQFAERTRDYANATEELAAISREKEAAVNPWPEGFRVTGPDADGKVWLHYEKTSGSALPHSYTVALGPSVNPVGEAALRAKKRAD